MPHFSPLLLGSLESALTAAGSKWESYHCRHEQPIEEDWRHREGIELVKPPASEARAERTLLELFVKRRSL